MNKPFPMSQTETRQSQLAHHEHLPDVPLEELEEALVVVMHGLHQQCMEDTTAMEEIV